MMSAPKEPGMMYKKHAKEMAKKKEVKMKKMMKKGKMSHAAMENSVMDKKSDKMMMKKTKKAKKMPKLGSGKRFASLTKKLAGKGAKNPKALAAFIGRKKFGGKKMAMLAKKGKK